MSRRLTLAQAGGSHARYSRRHFLRQVLGAGALAFSGADMAVARDDTLESFRFAFITDLHLMQGGALRSREGIAACLDAVEKLNPRADFIVCGGDLVHSAPELSVTDAGAALDLFLKTWEDHTELPTHWVFGNHDLAGTSNPTAATGDKEYGKGLFKDRLRIPRLYYSFDWKGWHFVVLDDIDVQPRHGFIGKLFNEELAFLQADLNAHRRTPTIICTHIPIASEMPFDPAMTHEIANQHRQPPKDAVCTNGAAVTAEAPGHNIRAILSGHLHYQEILDFNGTRIINCGAVCGNWWQGARAGCPEGFGVVDVNAGGSILFEYHGYGWKA